MIPTRSLLLTLLAAAGLLTPPPSRAAQADTISLAGTWRFELDRSKSGIREKWFERALPGKIKLPGSLPAQGVGDDITVGTRWTGDIVDKSWFTAPESAKYRQPGNVKVPFWLQPQKYYAGAAWYQREFKLPRKWTGKRVVLSLERPHWETRVWLDGKYLGPNRSLSTPHEYDLGTELAPGRHLLTIRVDNSLVVDIGVNSHSVTDHTQGNWNGIVGDISLRAISLVWIEDLQVYPHVATRSITVKGRIGNATARAGNGELLLSCDRMNASDDRNRRQKTVPVTWAPEGGAFQVDLAMGENSVLWDEFSPACYALTASLADKGSARTTVFGLREISTQGTQLALNGRKIFVRGTLECCIFPLTGHPPTDVESWKRIIRIAKAHGLNLLRFHSYCPPEAAFIAADELGFYYQIETCWANQSTTIGDGKPVDQWVYDETERILRAYGNHPSFLLMPHGNEPGGRNAAAWLARWVDHFKARDSRRLWSSGSGWPELAENQFHVTPDPRIQHWGAGLSSRINSQPPETTTDYRDYIRKWSVPVISHEIGEWCVYPNFDEIPKYKGYLKPRNFEIFRDSLKAHGMSGQAHAFFLASGKLQTLCYKEDIESALRTPGMGGFELLDLHDFPGQGTALVGVLDPFWGNKGYVTAADYSRFCNSTVPLARLSKRVFTTGEQLHADIEVAHFGPTPLANAVTTWRLVGDDHKAVASGRFPASTILVGNGFAPGAIILELTNLPAPARYRLAVGIESFVPDDILPSKPLKPTRNYCENGWEVWLYPSAVHTSPPPGIAIVDDLSDQTVAALNQGGKALLLIAPDRVKGDRLGKVALGFSSIFWNTAWTRRQPPHTLGILCNPKHPAFAEFPTDYHSNWQWWYLLSRAGAMILDGLPKDLRPTVQVIDDWVTNRKLGLVFEARVGKGKLLVCSIDLKRDLDQNPVARQMLHSLLNYMTGPKFKPAVALTPSQIQVLVAER